MEAEQAEIETKIEAMIEPMIKGMQRHLGVDSVFDTDSKKVLVEKMIRHYTRRNRGFSKGKVTGASQVQFTDEEQAEIDEFCNFFGGWYGYRNVKEIIDAGGKGVLQEAAASGKINVIKYLVSNGANVNVGVEHLGRTPLHNAAAHGQFETVKYLISIGADVNAKRDNNRTPLFEATLCGKTEIVKYLVSAGADVNVKTSGGNTMLHYAAEKGYIEIVEFLISMGLDVNVQGLYGRTPLHNAAIHFCADPSKKRIIAELLVSQGADIHTKDERGETPLDYARGWKDKEVHKYLKSIGAKPGKQARKTLDT